MCAGARATGSRARSGLRGDRDAVSLRGKTPRADPLASRNSHLCTSPPRPSSSAPNMIPFRAFSMVCREEKFPCNSQAAPNWSGITGSAHSSHQRRPIQIVLKKRWATRGATATLSFFNRSRARPAARPCTISCGFEPSGTIPFPGADSIFSSLCGAISGRLRFAVRSSRAAIPTTETPRFKRSTIGSAVSSGTAIQEQI
jgi:hypothetical protein